MEIYIHTYKCTDIHTCKYFPFLINFLYAFKCLFVFNILEIIFEMNSVKCNVFPFGLRSQLRVLI